jgi:hypothetical protein
MTTAEKIYRMKEELKTVMALAAVRKAGAK